MSVREWPDNSLVFDQLINEGWSPAPFSTYVFKVAGRCNLACDYCYMYEKADQSWKDKPVSMSDEVVTAAFKRIYEHSKAHSVKRIFVSIHGGEPLMRGAGFLERFVAIANEELGDIESYISLQTNGILFNEDIAKVCVELGIKVAFSLDGDQVANDRHRLYKNKKSSYEKTVSSIRLANQPQFREVFSGLLAVIDLENDPIATYEHLRSFDPPFINFLLPDATWNAPPPGLISGSNDQTPYANWLIPIFERWMAEESFIDIGLFSSITGLILGDQSGCEVFGTSSIDHLVIESNGAIEQTDVLKISFNGAPNTFLNVFDHTLDEALANPGVMARQINEKGLCETCQGCPVKPVCGGGYYPHRYKSGSGFLNPSVYCADLYALIRYINTYLQTALKNEINSIERLDVCPTN